MKQFIAFLMLIGLVGNLSAQNEIIALVNKPNDKQIRATVKTERTMYVGLTINPDTRNEINFRVQKVNPGISYVDFDVSKVHKSTNELKRIVQDAGTWTKNNAINNGLPYVVALWEKKVNFAKCKLNNGKVCKYCRDKGFHLEGRVDKATARYNPHGEYEIIDKQ